MGSSSAVAGRLDFSIGKEFELRVRRRLGAQVHHPFPSPSGSFFMLATFRRSLSRLSEESVGLVLQSCLGGLEKGFHVLEVSHNHFRFSVSSKVVGFLVYKLRRVIGVCFDVYFHLWSNGAPHWEREKRLWEAEEAKKWSLVLSKSQKRSAKSSAKQIKKVCFNPQLVLPSPKTKHVPGFPHSICFGSIKAPISVDSHGQFSGGKDLNIQVLHKPAHEVDSEDSVRSVQAQDSDRSVQVQDLHFDQNFLRRGKQQVPNTNFKSALKKTDHFVSLNLGSGFLVSNHGRPVLRGAPNSFPLNSARCSRCLRWGHLSKSCKFPVRCLTCFNYGHRARSCFAQPKHRLQWKPKERVHITSNVGTVL